MKNFAVKISLVNFFALLIFVFSACQTAELSRLEATPPVTPTVTIETNSNINRPVSEPYTGELSIFESEERGENLQIDRVMDILEIVEGKTVADIGAGSGWFTVRAAKRVGERGKVFAVEINQEYIDYINKRTEKENYKNIQTVVGTEVNPNLPTNTIDAVLILKTYHEIGEPIKVLLNLKKSLKKDALVGIIDKNGSGDDHGINKEIVIEEAKRAGFVLKKEYDFTKADGMDYFLVFYVK